MTTNVRKLYQKLVLERTRDAHYRGKTQRVDRFQVGQSTTCGDEISLSIQLSEDRQAIGAVRYEGEGCVIAMASADWMAEALCGKSLAEVNQLIEQVRRVIQGDALCLLELREFAIFQMISQLPGRVRCTTLPWDTLEKALTQEAEPALELRQTALTI